ncbi:hypothetical protein [Halorubrum vacuolatum]|uniref:Uncharacterized protein n=1 Tax=Halorubrum vacuolatum TaxID=63740 RepID=A0A238WDQ0_HALVU|nr:hypothetical protein [Halorubrum vacuolatum]SNR44394.1 hypothetical protein SAMN06264855_10733 [Halorubrum vacuolatum]
MDQLVFPVAVVGSVATLLMVVGMLYLVWISMGDDRHAPALGEAAGTEPPEIDGDAESDAPELAEGEAA